ncbi:MAG TPA: hypothetical protein VER04_29845 [Polyangiaceae bacterium]|jgi:hypothetical protein|nr:hypothetical protein [Polyangiaceae bacterium]
MSDEAVTDIAREQEKSWASPPRIVQRPRDGSEEPADLDEPAADSFGERDTEPNIDAQILRIALNMGLK